MQAMILAGGLGTRLRPLTFSIPKPLLPVGERPILQIILEQMKQADITEIVLATGYQAELIRTFCGDGSRFGVHISYVHEQQPLGTAGPLALVRQRVHRDLQRNQAFLLMNGDIVTSLDLSKFLQAGNKNPADLTVGYTKHLQRSPFGVLSIENEVVRGIVEKPSQEFLVSAGIYCVKPPALEFIPDETFFTMPELMQKMIANGHRVAAHFIDNCWIGMETIEHFDQAIKELNKFSGDGGTPAQG